MVTQLWACPRCGRVYAFGPNPPPGFRCPANGRLTEEVHALSSDLLMIGGHLPLKTSPPGGWDL